MEAICAAYTRAHPDVTIDVQVTSWSEYWTKLEAAATGGTLPDVFWMHTDEMLRYADGGILADLTDLYDDAGYYEAHFSQGLLDNARGSDGRIYGVPKDRDTICLVYSRELFDAAGVSYPDESWTWHDLTGASQAIYDATGKYGYLAYNDEHLGYWSYVYQAGGYILTPDGKHAGYTQPATKKAIAFYVSLQDEPWCRRRRSLRRPSRPRRSSRARRRCTSREAGGCAPSWRTIRPWSASGMWPCCRPAPIRSRATGARSSPTA